MSQNSKYLTPAVKAYLEENGYCPPYQYTHDGWFAYQNLTDCMPIKVDIPVAFIANYNLHSQTKRTEMNEVLIANYLYHSKTLPNEQEHLDSMSNGKRQRTIKWFESFNGNRYIYIAKACDLPTFDQIH